MQRVPWMASWVSSVTQTAVALTQDEVPALLAHSKVKAILVGDEHNYSRLLIRPGMPVYDDKKYHPGIP